MDAGWVLLGLVGVCTCVWGGRNGTFHRVNKRSLLFVEKTACYKELGCFSNGPPFYHPVFRPFSVPPQHPDVIKTVFQLYTRRNRNRPIFVSPYRPKSVRKSPFNPTAITRVLIHGFNDNQAITSWIKRLKDVILERAEENVLVVDWSGANRLPYTFTVANSRLVGAQIAHFITFLYKTQGASPESFHLIGHSLGAHIAGYAGERLHKLGRISGLDPAGPFFRRVAERVRLDPEDAVFVDVIHSDPGTSILQGLGTTEDAGDVDFFPGGGDPPGCKQTLARSVVEDIPTEAIGNLVACQHLRATDFFIYSFNQNGCLFVGAECTSWADFMKGHCNCGHDGQRCAIMGFYAPSYTVPSGADRRLYLKVGPERPFCVHQYQVIIHYHSFSRRKTYGIEMNHVELTVKGNLEKLKGRIHLEVNLAETHQIKKFLLSSDRPMGKAMSATLSISRSSSTADDYVSEHAAQVTVDRIEIVYLYPLPKKFLTSKVCKISENPHGYGGRSFMFTACH